MTEATLTLMETALERIPHDTPVVFYTSKETYNYLRGIRANWRRRKRRARYTRRRGWVRPRHRRSRR